MNAADQKIEMPRARVLPIRSTSTLKMKAPAVANGERQHLVCAYELPGCKGRGFGFTGAHDVHISWQNDGIWTVVFNAILWTAGRDGSGIAPASSPEVSSRYREANRFKIRIECRFQNSICWLP
jgi:hypothetical protein